MNVRLQYNTEFLGGIYSEQGLTLNSYSVNMQMITKTENSTELNIAMERLKCFLYSILADTVFVHQKHHERAMLMQAMGMNVTTMPDEPVDQIIGMMLYCKLNAIMEGRIVVTSLDISSKDSEGVWYQHSNKEDTGVFEQSGWWGQPDSLNHNIELDTDAEGKIVKVLPNSWTEYNLMWPDEQLDNTGNTIVYANFGKNEVDTIQ